jgi:transposase
MRVMVERCCGLDVHQETVVACLLIGAPGVRPTKEVRTFRTMTRELQALRDWLKAAGVTHVGMESTGVYWRPVYAVLEGHFELIVGNARHIRNVPGRKTKGLSLDNRIGRKESRLRQRRNERIGKCE